MLELPYRFVVPYPIRESELLDFTQLEWDMLEAGGLETYDLTSPQMREVFAVRRINPGLSAFDCMCLVSTRHHENGVLLTGDKLLRNTAKREELRTHGVLWIVDELRAKSDYDEALIRMALEIWRDDQSVFLPQDEVQRRLS